jgi:SagB-type dehydrogenase family enzyme
MSERVWDRLRMPRAERDGIWELFHENSRISPFEHYVPDEAVTARVEALWTSLPYPNYPRFDLPAELVPMHQGLLDAILARRTAREMEPVQLTRAQLGTLLHCGYGITRDNAGTPWPRPFRTVPSGGALYPLELYFHTTLVDDLPTGLYHYNPSRNDVCLLREGDLSAELRAALVFPEVVNDASVLLVVTAIMERSTFKYADRGYRFIMLEAGHVAQNVNLAAVGLGLGAVNIGGFYEHRLDETLRLDGVTHSSVYVIGIGRDTEPRP